MLDNTINKNEATFRFYEELNDFLPVRTRKISILYQFYGHPSVKDAIEAQGIPHTEVDLIIVNSQSVDFNYRLEDGDHVHIYPVFESLDISTIIHLRPKPLRNPKFILDVHLGKLARLLRLVGMDSLYRNDYKGDEIVKIAIREKRIILTMDRHLLKRKTVTHGIWIQSRQPEVQLLDVIKNLDLYSRLNPFSRCLICNGKVKPVDKNRILNRLEPRTKTHFDTFTICSDCNRIYWQGSHCDRMKDRLENWNVAWNNPASSE